MLKHPDPLEIERAERELLVKLGWLFKNSLNEFSTNIGRSIEYLNEIILPLVMASKEGKSYNPFWEIIEKYAQHILITKLEKDGYKVLPLGYSADVTLEKEDHVLSIEVKTANIENLSDFRGTINLGINQTTHPALLKVGEGYLPFPLLVYPSIPPMYELPDGTKKLVFTFGFLFIYPSYSDIVEEIGEDYKRIRQFFIEKVNDILIRLGASTSNTKKELIAESIIRGIFVHKLERKELLDSLGLSNEELEIIQDFGAKISETAEKFRERDIRPVAIISISIPSGFLLEYYLESFVSGKNYARSARFHYGDGMFRVLREKTGEDFPRVVFLDVDAKYLDKLRKYFPQIMILHYGLRRL